MLEQAVKIRSLRSHWFVVQLRIPHPAPLAKNPFPKSDRLLGTPVIIAGPQHCGTARRVCFHERRLNQASMNVFYEENGDFKVGRVLAQSERGVTLQSYINSLAQQMLTVLSDSAREAMKHGIGRRAAVSGDHFES